MATILHIETSTSVCSCALSRDMNILVSKEMREGQSHASCLGLFVEDILAYARNNELMPDAVAVSCGPGSYTGLRIGVSEAKGLSYGLAIPMIAINTPLIMASMLRDTIDSDTFLCPMIDARRMEVYATIFDKNLTLIRKTSADIVGADTYCEFLEQHKIVFFGDGADKCKEVISHPNAQFLPDICPLATGMVFLAEKAFGDKNFVDSAYFEPFYLKEFVATVAKNKIL